MKYKYNIDIGGVLRKNKNKEEIIMSITLQ